MMIDDNLLASVLLLALLFGLVLGVSASSSNNCTTTQPSKWTTDGIRIYLLPKTVFQNPLHAYSTPEKAITEVPHPLYPYLQI